MFALESNENLPDKEAFRAAVRSYQSYLLPFLSGKNDIQQIFTMPNQFNSETIPVFLSEEVYLSFQNNYLKNHGFLNKIETNQQILSLKKMTGDKLFEMLPKSSLPAFFVFLSEKSEKEELLFNFKLAKIFTECFQEIQTELDFEALLEKTVESQIGNPVQRKINLLQSFRELFEKNEWIVLISQTTSNKILTGEISRDNFDFDRNDDKRIVIFSDTQAFEDFKNNTNQTQVKFYTIKVEGKKIFGADLSKYEVIFVNPLPPKATKISQENFRQLNELFAAAKIENILLRISKFRLGYGKDYIDVKEFQKYILPIDKRLAVPNLPNFDLPVFLIEDDLGNKKIPLFATEDCFQRFRLQNAESMNLIEPYLIEGTRLFQILSRREMPQIIFNLNNQQIICEPNFALKVFCA